MTNVEACTRHSTCINILSVIAMLDDRGGSLSPPSPTPGALGPRWYLLMVVGHNNAARLHGMGPEAKGGVMPPSMLSLQCNAHRLKKESIVPGYLDFGLREQVHSHSPDHDRVSDGKGPGSVQERSKANSGAPSMHPLIFYYNPLLET